MRRRILALIGATALLAVFACVALALSARPSTSARQQERAEAQARWDARGFTGYRMVLEEASCTADYEVRAERVTWGYESPCGRGQARAISNLFSLISRGDEARSCSGPGCSCERITTIEARYDAELGYPRQITIHTRLWPNWGQASFWSQLASAWRYPCDGGGERTLAV
jgi:hypothetical protein